MKQKCLWCFYQEFDYYSNTIIEQKYKIFQLMESKEEINLKVAEEQIAQGVYLHQ